MNTLLKAYPGILAVILAIKTDSAIAELRLLKGHQQIALQAWDAGRSMAEGLLTHIEKLMGENNVGWQDIDGLIVFMGPGSFTGLRIGATVANAIVYAQGIPIIGMGGGEWLADGTDKLQNGDNDKQVIPRYGSPPNTTKPGSKRS